MSAQAATVASVARRGYLAGFTDDELFARQVVKLAEELAEAAATVEADDPVLADFLNVIARLETPAKRIFDRKSAFIGATINTPEAVKEWTDCQVVLFTGSYALHIPDIGFATQEKALADEARGVRNGKA